MRGLVCCIRSLLSLICCFVKLAILIYFIVSTLDTPESEIVDILIKKIIYKLHGRIYIITGCCNSKTCCLVESTACIVPLIVTAVDCYRYRNVIASLLSKTCLFNCITCCVCKIPPLVNHSKYTSCRKLRDIFIICLCE